MEQKMANCFICNEAFEFGNGKYYGRVIANYKISICESCYSCSHDGYSPEHTKKLLAWFEDNNIPSPKLNDKSLIPRGDI